MSLLAALAESVLNTVGVCSFLYDTSAKQANAQLVDQLLQTLLRHSLCPNQRRGCLEKRARRQRHYECNRRGNALVEFVQLACGLVEPNDLRYVYNWLLTLLRHGADPDIEPYPADMSLMHGQSNLRLQSGSGQPLDLLLHHFNQHHGVRLVSTTYALRLLLLLCNTTAYRHVNYAFRNFRRTASRRMPMECDDGSNLAEGNRSDVVPFLSFQGLVAELATTPRSLKAAARYAIHRSVQRQLALKIPQLPLPPSLHRYLLLELD